MAIDSEEKRWSMLRLSGGIGRGIVFNPSGSNADTEPERFTIIGIYAGNLTIADATTITVSEITGGADLSTLSYCVFDAADIGSASIIKQGNDESTDSNGDLVIDLTGLGVPVGTTLTIIITNYTTAPADTDRAAVCYADAA